jgi:hypothetical protein
MRIMFLSLEYLGRSLASTARAGIGADYGLLVGGLPTRSEQRLEPAAETAGFVEMR